MRRLLRRRYLAPVVAVAVTLGAGAVVYARRDSATTQYRTVAAVMGTVTQTISLSGNLTPTGESDMDFTSAGRVNAVSVQVGQAVKAGDVLAGIDPTALQGALVQAQANLTAAQARLSLDQSGATASSLTQAHASVNSDQVALHNAQTALTDTEAVNQQTVSADQSAVSTDCTANPASPQCAVDRQKLAGDQARAQQSNDQAAGQVSTARVQLQNAQASLSALEQGTTAQQLQIDQSQLQVDQVNVNNAQRALTQATLMAPVAGLVGQVNVTVGQAVSGNGSSSNSSSSSSSTTTSHAIVILTPGAFAVTGTVSDTQVNQVAIGQRARVTPAGSAEAIGGKVTAVSQEATVTSGVATFAVTVTLDGNNPALHAGVSASISIVVNQVAQVVTVPTSAVQTTAAGSTVQLLVDGVPQSVAVQVGLSDALRTEITSGVNVGATVVLATVTGTVPTPAAAGGGGLFGVGGGVRGGGGGGRGGG